MIRMVSPSIIKSLRLYIQHQVYVIQVLWVLASWFYYRNIQRGSNMTGTDLCVNKPYCAAAVPPWEIEATTSTLPPARVRTCSVLSGSCWSDEQLWLQKKNQSRSYLNHPVLRCTVLQNSNLITTSEHYLCHPSAVIFYYFIVVL